MQFESDQALANRKRRRRIRGYGHLPPDDPGMAPRYNSETTLDECKAFLHLSNEMYSTVRDDYEAICRDMGIERKKTVMENGVWYVASIPEPAFVVLACAGGLPAVKASLYCWRGNTNSRPQASLQRPARAGEPAPQCYDASSAAESGTYNLLKLIRRPFTITMRAKTLQMPSSSAGSLEPFIWLEVTELLEHPHARMNFSATCIVRQKPQPAWSSVGPTGLLTDICVHRTRKP